LAIGVPFVTALYEYSLPTSPMPLVIVVSVGSAQNSSAAACVLMADSVPRRPRS